MQSAQNVCRANAIGDRLGRLCYRGKGGHSPQSVGQVGWLRRAWGHAMPSAAASRWAALSAA